MSRGILGKKKKEKLKGRKLTRKKKKVKEGEG
ncbi:hypothetical protein QG37_03062 [Candidozyma auris]|uniref:Uncharacterized protein n=1 Tax=Candidozyma auris TaxID=498019 RepID=A0A0L0P1I2_CANAR|nr:hypothetical protein QG37_03062 [[Candida] auris]